MRLPLHISFRLDRNTGNGFYSCQARDSPKFEHQMRVFFLPKCWEVGKYTFERQMRNNQAHVKCCLLSNQTIVCLVSFFIFAFGNERRIRESDRKKKRGMRDFRNPAWNQIIWRSPWSSITQLLQVTTLVTFFFLSSFFTENVL